MNTRNTPLWIQALPVFLIVLFFLAQVFLNLDRLQSGDSPGALIVNVVLLSIPLGLLCFSIWLLAAAREQISRTGSLEARLALRVYFVPRLAGILIAVFASSFAWNVLRMQAGFWQVLSEFFLSLLPALVIGVVVGLAWRWEWVGALGFGLMALYFLASFLDGLAQGLAVLLTFAAPLAAVAALFWLNWQRRRALPPAPRSS